MFFESLTHGLSLPFRFNVTIRFKSCVSFEHLTTTTGGSVKGSNFLNALGKTVF